MTGLMKVYDTFDSWEHFHEAVKHHIALTHEPLIKASSKRVTTHNKNVSTKMRYPEEMVYAYFSYRCSHRGTFKPKGTGLRGTKSMKTQCRAKIGASLDHKDPNKIVVSIVDNRHNHEISEELFKRYAVNRALNDSEREHADMLCSLNLPHKEICDILKLLTGKCVTAQDVSNHVKRRQFKKEREKLASSAVSGDVQITLQIGEEEQEMDLDLSAGIVKQEVHSPGDFPDSTADALNDIQLLLQKVKARQDKDPGLTIEFGVNAASELEFLFIQTSLMQNILKACPNYVLNNSMYCINHSLMPLLSFLIFDDNGKSHIVGYTLVGNASSDLCERIFDVFKKHNRNCKEIKTCTADSDMVAVYHQELQTFMPTRVSLNVMFDKLMFYYDTVRSKFSTVISAFKHLQKDITPFALSVCGDEFKESEEWMVSETESEGYLVHKGDIHVNTSLHNCSCPFFKTLLSLPCRHIIALAKFLKLCPLLDKEMFPNRWHLCYNHSPSNSESISQVSSLPQSTGPLSRRDKFCLAKTKLDKIMSKLLDSPMFDYYLGKLDEIDKHITSLTRFTVQDINDSSSTHSSVSHAKKISSPVSAVASRVSVVASSVPRVASTSTVPRVASTSTVPRVASTLAVSKVASTPAVSRVASTPAVSSVISPMTGPFWA